MKCQNNLPLKPKDLDDLQFRHSESKKQLRILELNTHKIAVFFTPPDSESSHSKYQAKWFGQKDYLPQPQEW